MTVSVSVFRHNLLCAASRRCTAGGGRAELLFLAVVDVVNLDSPSEEPDDDFSRENNAASAGEESGLGGRNQGAGIFPDGSTS